MGYESSLHLIDVKIKADSVAEVMRVLRTRRGCGLAPIRYFLERAALNRDGFLVFKSSEDGLDPYEPDEDDGTVPALFGKWYEDGQIASWLKQHSEKGARMVLHSIEADGDAWGWEFDGRGRMRKLTLRPLGKWE